MRQLNLKIRNGYSRVDAASVFLPVHLHRSSDNKGNWTAEWDYDGLSSMSTHLRVTRQR